MNSLSAEDKDRSDKVHRHRRRKRQPAGKKLKSVFKRRSVMMILYLLALIAGIIVVYKLAPGFLDTAE